MSFWKRTLAIFKAEPVRLELRSGLHVIGDIDSIADTSCTIKKYDGSTIIVQFDEIISVQPGVPKL